MNRQKQFTGTTRQRGISMVELMVGLLIGVFLMGGVLQVFDNSKRGYRYQEGLSQVQEQGRFAMQFLTWNLRVAGYPANNPPAGNKIFGTDGATDTVAMRFDSALDCRDIATAGGVAVNTFRVFRNNLECSGDGITWDIFVTDIEDMEVLYGEDLTTDGVANRYVTATQGPTWANVVSVRLSLIARSSDFAVRQPETYTDLAGNVIAPNDSRLRRVFVSTINVRN
jgi:type IV pilus assembly protein PilW